MTNLENLRHSAAHLLAAAVLKLWPNTKRTIGPTIEEGFYYDFEFTHPISESDLPKIEEEMKKIIPSWKKFEHYEVTKEQAIKEFKNNKYKIELIEEFSKEEKKLTFYKSGDYIDLCRGGHVENPSKELKNFKLLKLAGAYWRGNEKNKMLTRIYGTAFPTKEELENYLKMLEEAKKRDHRKIGKELDLFSFHDEAPGMPFLHAKGMIIWDELLGYWKEIHNKANYKIVKTPIILNKNLWLTSQHWIHYKENMYTLKIDNEDYAVKPMNCPGGILIYKTKLHSYKDLPLKIGEIGLVHRHELSGVLSGMFRVRSFHQDDAHIFCREDQIEEEVINIINLFDEIYKKFNLGYNIELSTKPEKSMGSDEEWRRAENALENAIKKKKLNYKINPGDGAFYGPKVDFHIKDALGRTWQCGTIQLDFQQPQNFDLYYEGNDGKKHRPTMLHRVAYGSLERFFGVLIEHYAGKFPLWLSPIQVILITVADRHLEYTKKLENELKEKNIRVEIDNRTESISKKIRDSQIQKIPYAITIGDKEIESGNLAVRTRENQVITLRKEEFIQKLIKEDKEKL
ncbi:threonine--tRNA ligase [Candidatus Woesearchaeota archaeon]|nr:threonine--tRNA ligase [Candidatus Woesearchaeota archaeon]